LVETDGKTGKKIHFRVLSTTIIMMHVDPSSAIIVSFSVVDAMTIDSNGFDPSISIYNMFDLVLVMRVLFTMTDKEDCCCWGRGKSNAK
jgi:hypothetical protein